MPLKQHDSLIMQLKQVFHLVSKHFVNWPDETEHWQMPPADYTGMQWLRDDCDGFCLACRVLLRRLEIPNRLVYCEVDNTGHLVVEVEGWILDNRQDTVVPNVLLSNYTWLRISGFNPGEPWREIVAPSSA